MFGSRLSDVPVSGVRRSSIAHARHASPSIAALLILAGCTSGTGPSDAGVRLAVTGLAPSLPAGVATFAVTAEDAFDHPLTSYRGTVHFASTDSLADVPADYPFVAADAGTHTFHATFKTVGGQALTASASGALTAEATVTVTGGAASTLAVSGLPCGLVVTAKDQFDNVAAGYRGTVHFSSTDPLSVLPADFMFGEADGGTHSFPVNFDSAGSQTVTATDAANAITGGQTIDAHVSATPAGKSIYVANEGNNSITVYNSGAICNAAPAAVIAGSNTALQLPYALALDGAGRLYVSNRGNSSVAVFAPGATGNVAPIATIAGSNTGLGLFGDLGPIAVDVMGRLYVGNGFNCSAELGCLGGYSITVYAAGANGNVAPIATLAGDSTQMFEPDGLTVDASGRLYVATYFVPRVNVYAPGANGNTAPLATIEGSSTRLSSPAAVALDPSGRLYVANGDARITVYAPGATGNTSPIAVIAGNNTGLTTGTSMGIAADAAGRLYLANGGADITVFAAGASGNVAPVATIVGSATGVSEPTWVAF